MAASNDNISMALYCDFENVALGVRDANYDRFDIKPVLERLLLKGSIVVKKAYCDWERYKEFKGKMHEASFELIEIPHVRVSGKNSADIRMVVDALDLCYTKAHVNTFVIISGDSDFSPLVSKLRENAKYVIGVGVKNSTSDLLVANCDEFIFIDDLVRESRRNAASREKRQAPAPRRQNEVVGEERKPKEDLETRKTKAIDIVAETFDALMAERGDGGKIWASALKQAIKRRRPDFNEVYFGFRTFGNLLEEAQLRGLLDIGRDDKSGAFVFRNHRQISGEEGSNPVPALVETALLTATPATPETQLEGENADNTAETPAHAAADDNSGAAAERTEQNQGRRNSRFPRNGRNNRPAQTDRFAAQAPLAAESATPAASTEADATPVTPVFEPVAEQARAMPVSRNHDDYDPLQAEWDAADAAALIASGMLPGQGGNRPQGKGRGANPKQGGKPANAQGGRNAGRPDPRRNPAVDRFAPAPAPAPAPRPAAPGRGAPAGRKPASARNARPLPDYDETPLPVAAAVNLASDAVASAPLQAPEASNPAPVENAAAMDSAPKRRAKSAAKKPARDGVEIEAPAASASPDSDESPKPARKPRRPAAKKAAATEES